MKDFNNLTENEIKLFEKVINRLMKKNENTFSYYIPILKIKYLTDANNKFTICILKASDTIVAGASKRMTAYFRTRSGRLFKPDNPNLEIAKQLAFKRAVEAFYYDNNNFNFNAQINGTKTTIGALAFDVKVPILTNNILYPTGSHV